MTPSKPSRSQFRLRGRHGWLASCALAAAVAGPVAQSFGAHPAPSLQTADSVRGSIGVLRNGSIFTADGAGHTGNPGDRAIDFGTVATGPVFVQDGSFINAATANNELTVSFWAKKYDMANNSAFWFISPSSSGTARGYQAHLPWSDRVIYFDSAGCCTAPTQRINANINTFPPYNDAALGDSWWYSWHHFVFSQKQGTKKVWIDGVNFMNRTGANALPVDFTSLVIGSEGGFGNVYHGQIDDFVIYSTELNDEQIMDLYNGTAPQDLEPAPGVLAHWTFDDAPPEGQYLSVSPTPNSATAAPNLIQIVHLDGEVPWDDDNVKLYVDGVEVATTLVKIGDRSTLTYVPSPLLEVQSQHTVVIESPTSSGPKFAEWSFVVGPYTADVVADRVGVMTGGSAFTVTGGGRSGEPGDFAVDFSRVNTGPVLINDVAFMNEAATGGSMSFSFWAYKYDIAAGSVFWGLSPSSNNGERGYQAHLPWSDSTIYFDTAGCCTAGAQRLNANISTFPSYQLVGNPTWWNNWRHYVFLQTGSTKQIWIDGQLFLEGTGANPLKTDFRQLRIGSDNVGGGLFHGMVDDFAVFSTQLTPTQIEDLSIGALPTDLGDESGLKAYWDFNDIPADGLFRSFSPAPLTTQGAPNLVRVVHQQGGTPWDLNLVTLKVDGVTVAADKTSIDGLDTISFVPSPLFAPRSVHTARLEYPLAAGGTGVKEWTFTVGAYSLDVQHSYVGLFEGAANFTPDAGGRSGAEGDYAVDLGANQTQQGVHVLDVSFINAATANDELAVVGWQKLYSTAAGYFFWANSPSSSGSQRGFGGTAPWSDGNLYFDTAGCCTAPTQRMFANITTFPLYSGSPTWWNDWHHVIFQKKGAHKEIWIDGQLFLQGDGANPLPTDFVDAYFGNDRPDNAQVRGIYDDVAIFGKALDGAAIEDLAAGALPSDLSPDLDLLAYWNFNDGPPAPVRITSITRDDATHLVVAWSGGKAPYWVERKENLSDPTWTKVIMTDGKSATVTVEGKTGFFRISDQAVP